MQEADLYLYKALVERAYDGDTCTVLVDCGFGIYNRLTLRFYGIDTPEMRGDDKVRGKEVRDIVREHIVGKEVYIRTRKDKTGKYGRMLATIYVDIDGDGELDNLNEWLLLEGHAEEYMK